jgi:hypothetical protein
MSLRGEAEAISPFYSAHVLRLSRLRAVSDACTKHSSESRHFVAQARTHWVLVMMDEVTFWKINVYLWGVDFFQWKTCKHAGSSLAF